MRPGLKTLLGATLVVPGLLIMTLGRQATYGDEPGRFGRLFRFGGGSSNAAGSAPGPAAPAPPSPADQPPSMLFSTSAATGATVGVGASGPSPRLLPQPRVSRPATESDPILTRICLVRSSDGNQFGMCLQLFADGTVLDNEGVHHLSQGDIKPIVDALQSGDLYRLKGHCGSPATDFVEQVHLVVYERSLGRLRANAFSYSGNPQGCDHAVRHLHTALETLQAKLSRNAAPATAATGGTAAPFGTSTQPALSGSGHSISLTPAN
jgi:hypothetical protein